ncbi:MAG: hypothetical protein WB611_09855, partial [Stellaceae bacterium]
APRYTLSASGLLLILRQTVEPTRFSQISSPGASTPFEKSGLGLSQSCPARAYVSRVFRKGRTHPIRLAFSLLGSLILMLTVGYGISFDAEHLAYAAFDQDQTTRATNYSKTSQGCLLR